MVQGPLRGYFPEPTKSILSVYPQNVPRVQALFRGYGIQIVTGGRYLGGFVGSKAYWDRWLGEKVEVWRDSVSTLAGVVRRHPQTTYAGLQKYLQQEWALVQRVTPDIGMAF